VNASLTTTQLATASDLDCIWRKKSYGVRETQCGKRFDCSMSLVDLGFAYCPFCGSKIVEKGIGEA
jgi:hypothetical protein